MGLFVEILTTALSSNNGYFIIWLRVLRTILASPTPLGEKFVFCSTVLIEPSRLSMFCDDKLTNVANIVSWSQDFWNLSMRNDATDLKNLDGS